LLFLHRGLQQQKKWHREFGIDTLNIVCDHWTQNYHTFGGSKVSQEILLVFEPTRTLPRLKAMLASRFDLVELSGSGDFNDQIQNLNAHKVVGLFVRLAFQIDQAVLSSFPNLRFVCSVTTATTHIDVKYACDKGISIFTLRDCPEILPGITGTSELGLSLSLVLHHKLFVAKQRVIDGAWNREGLFRRQLSGRVAGIIGFGRLGANIARYCEALGMRVIYNDLTMRDTETAQFCSISDLLSQSYLVFMCASYQNDDPPILTGKMLGSIHEPIILVNIARGELIAEDFLSPGLELGLISGFGSDVVCGEPEVPNYIKEKLALPNVIVTPHIGGATEDSIEITEIAMAQSLLGHLAL